MPTLCLAHTYTLMHTNTHTQWHTHIFGALFARKSIIRLMEIWKLKLCKGINLPKIMILQNACDEQAKTSEEEQLV